MYTVRGRWAAVVLFLLVGLGSAVAAPNAEVELPRSVAQGDVLPVVVFSDTMISGTAELVLSDETRHSAPVWRAAGPSGSDDRSAWIALIGVSSTAAVGEAEVVVRVSGPPDDPPRPDKTETIPIRVEDGQFRSEEIALNRDMTELRTTDDPRRAEQSRTLWEVIQRINTDSRRHTGRFQLPVDEFRETSFFGDRREFRYIDGGSSRSIHNGMDLAAPTGTPVIAPANGEVVMAEDRIITGLSVVLEHLPGVFSLYYHLDSMDVVVGDEVSAGDSLGTVGSTGLSTGPHLHWELRVSGVAVDPRKYLSEPLVDMEMLRRSLSE